jgi:hypothetical protein
MNNAINTIKPKIIHAIVSGPSNDSDIPCPVELSDKTVLADAKTPLVTFSAIIIPPLDEY